MIMMVVVIVGTWETHLYLLLLGRRPLLFSVR